MTNDHDVDTFDDSQHQHKPEDDTGYQPTVQEAVCQPNKHLTPAQSNAEAGLPQTLNARFSAMHE